MDTPLLLEAKPHLQQVGARVGVEVVVWEWSGGEVLPAVTFADAGGDFFYFIRARPYGVLSFAKILLILWCWGRLPSQTY